MEISNIITIVCIWFQLATCIFSASDDYYISRPFHHFYSKGTLNDGVHQVLIHINGIRGLQVAAGPKEGSHRGIVARQVSNGRQIVNLVYNGVPTFLRDVEGFRISSDEVPSMVEGNEQDLALRECHVVKEEDPVDEFVRQFDDAAIKSHDASSFDLSPFALSNSSFISIHKSLDNLPEDLVPLTKFNTLKSQCFELNRKVKRIAKVVNRKRKLSQGGGVSPGGNSPREKRGLSELLIHPGTKWCGNGRLARSYNDLGGYINVDHCCRLHDLCPADIPRLTRKYGLYNYYLTTISHCNCDKRFKTCLKQSGTGASDVVGNIFFNIVRSHCFVFKKKKVCKKRGFWSCLKYGYEKQAVIREPVKWNW